MLNSKIIIESPGEIDFPVLLRIFNLARTSATGFSNRSTTLDDFLAMVKGERILLARNGRRITGFASVWEQSKFIHHLYINPEFQNLGIGGALLKECENLYGLPLSLKCIVENKRACRFYIKKGWREVERANGIDGPYILYRLE